MVMRMREKVKGKKGGIAHRKLYLNGQIQERRSEGDYLMAEFLEHVQRKLKAGLIKSVEDWDQAFEEAQRQHER
jgi:hypothetical protein